MVLAMMAGALAVGLGACTNSAGGGGLRGLGAETPYLPDQVAGGDRDRLEKRVQEERAAELAAMTPEERAQMNAERKQEADALWARAQQASPAQAADLYEELADNYPEHGHAAEARYREGVSLWRQGEYNGAHDRFEEYMKIAPINPHLKQIERMEFVAGTRLLDRGASLFRSDEPALEMLRFVAQNFPRGTYADDALYRLGRYYQGKREWDIAALSFKELLINHPRSEWQYMARLALGDTYLQRDQGTDYNAGFVDRDPREELPAEEAAAFAGPVRSGLELALEQFEVFLERMAVDSTRRAEYGPHIQYARARVQQLRGALAQKEQRTATWYARQGDARAADLYRQAARGWADGSRRVGGRSVGGTVRTTRPTGPVVPAGQEPPSIAPVTPPEIVPPETVPPGTFPPETSPPVLPPPEPGPTPATPTQPGTTWPTMPVPDAPPVTAPEPLPDRTPRSARDLPYAVGGVQRSPPPPPASGR